MEGRAEFLKRNEFKGDIKLPDIKRGELPCERYKRRKAERQQQIRRRIGIAALSGLIAFGSLRTYMEYRDSKNTLTLEQALENGHTLDDLGINKDIKDRIENIEDMLADENIKNEELIELSSKIEAVQMDVIKNKLSEVLNIAPSDIRLIPTDEDKRAYIDVKNIGIFERDSALDVFGKQKTISDDISNFIDEIADMQRTKDIIQNEDIDRKDIIKTYKKAIKETSKFAAGHMYGFDKINMKTIRVSEMEKAKKEAEKNQERDF